MPLNDDDARVVAGTTRVLQIIVAALSAGLVGFLGVVLFLQTGRAPGDAAAAPPLPVLTVAAFTFTVVLLPLSLLVPQLMIEATRRRIASEAAAPPGRGGVSPGSGPASDVGKLAKTYTLQKIAGAALNEGPAVLALVAYTFERSPIALGLFVILFVSLVLRFPRREQVGQWVERQLERLELDRRAAKLA